MLRQAHVRRRVPHASTAAIVCGTSGVALGRPALGFFHRRRSGSRGGQALSTAGARYTSGGRRASEGRRVVISVPPGVAAVGRRCGRGLGRTPVVGIACEWPGCRRSDRRSPSGPICGVRSSSGCSSGGCLSGDRHTQDSCSGAEVSVHSAGAPAVVRAVHRDVDVPEAIALAPVRSCAVDGRGGVLPGGIRSGVVPLGAIGLRPCLLYTSPSPRDRG